MKTKNKSAAVKVGSRGRRPLTSPLINKTTILERGLALTRDVPLQQLSIVRVAHELGVTAASIRYHLRGRDALTAGIVVLFYRNLLTSWPPQTGDWRSDVASISELIYRSYLRYPGVAAYFAAENRFRILASAARFDEETIAMFLERYLSIIRRVGLDPKRTTAYAVILLQQLHMTAHATNRHQWPGEQKAIEKHLKGLDARQFPNTTKLRDYYLSVAGETAFTHAVNLILSGLEYERKRSSVKNAKP